MATQSISQPVSPGYLDQAYNAATNAATWIGEKSRTAAASASDLASRAWAAISDAFSNIAQFFAYYANVAKDAVVAAGNTFAALPMNVKVVAGVGAVLAAVAGYLLAKCCAPAPAVTPPSTNASQAQSENPSATASTAASTAAASAAATRT